MSVPGWLGCWCGPFPGRGGGRDSTVVGSRQACCSQRAESCNHIKNIQVNRYFRDKTFSVFDWQGGCMQHKHLQRYLVRVWQEFSAAWHRPHASTQRSLIRASKAAPRPCPSSCCRPAVTRVTTPTCCCPLIAFTSLLHCLNIGKQVCSSRQ